jgi:mono/diheme cytochrome c family protein
MIGRDVKLVGGCAAACGIAMLLFGSAGTLGAQDRPAQSAGWVLPPEAETATNPLTVDEKVLAAGQSIYRDKCQRCHGPGGLGDGPDSDPDVREDMNLTDPKRAGNNPDGVVFYKVMNGRRRPKMPAFKEELTKEQVWTLVAYVQTLRKK